MAREVCAPPTPALLDFLPLPMTTVRTLLTFALLALVFTGCSSTASTTAPDASTTSSTDTVTASPDTTDTTVPTAELETAVGYAEALDQELSDFESQRQATATALESATADAIQTLENNPTTSQLRSATSTWRRQWDDVRSNVRSLWHAFADAESAAEQYFSHLERQTALISNPDLRASEQERNAALEQSWRNASVAATDDFKELYSFLQQGDDLYVTMLNASLRDGFEDNVDSLRNVSDSSMTLLDDLYGLTTSGLSLISKDPSNGSDTAASDDAGSMSDEQGR